MLERNGWSSLRSFDDAHEKSSNPDDHETERSSEWTRDLETITGSVGASEQRSISSDADATAAMSSHGKQRSSLGGVGTSCTAVRGAEFGHDQSSNTGTQPTGFRVVQICQTDRDETAGYDALKSVWKERGKEKGKRKGKERGKSRDKSKEGTSDTSNTKCSFCKGKDCPKSLT